MGCFLNLLDFPYIPWLPSGLYIKSISNPIHYIGQHFCFLFFLMRILWFPWLVFTDTQITPTQFEKYWCRGEHELWWWPTNFPRGWSYALKFRYILTWMLEAPAQIEHLRTLKKILILIMPMIMPIERKTSFEKHKICKGNTIMNMNMVGAKVILSTATVLLNLYSICPPSLLQKRIGCLALLEAHFVWSQKHQLSFSGVYFCIFCFIFASPHVQPDLPTSTVFFSPLMLHIYLA